MTEAQFKKIIWAHYKKEGRDLSWRKTRDPYRILVSEIMLQQTQVNRVEGFYRNFIREFPDFRSLASAKTPDVLKAWQGLGYNRRALMLRRAAQVVTEEYNGKLPQTREELEALPGIGKGTSGSLLAFAFNIPEVFIETNIRRVFIHFFFPKQKKVTDAELERYIKSTLSRDNPREWYWALMDYGSMLGLQRAAIKNPNIRSAHYKKQSAFKGSDRELRGKILKLLLEAARKRKDAKVLAASLSKKLNEPKQRMESVVEMLCREGFLSKSGRNQQFICINQ